MTKVGGDKFCQNTTKLPFCQKYNKVAFLSKIQQSFVKNTTKFCQKYNKVAF